MKKQPPKTHVFGRPGQPIFKNAYQSRLDIEEAVVADGVTEIGEKAFSGCLRLKTVRLPGSVEAIKEGAFRGCTALESVVLPEGLRIIGEQAFSNCAALENVVVPGSVAEIFPGAFSRCTALKSVAIREGVESIGVIAFAKCTSLESVAIPGSVAKIPSGAFLWCKGLKSVVIGNGVESIGLLAFAQCTSLESVVIPESVEAIDAKAFDGCKRLAEIGYSGKACRFEGGAMLSGDGTTLLRWMGWLPAFSKVAEVPASVTRVDDWAFEKSGELRRVRLPAGVAEIAANAFDGCDKLKKVEYSGKAYRFEGGAMLSGDGTTLLKWIGHLPPGKIVKVPDSVTKVGDGAFAFSKVRSVVLPEGLEAIGNHAFSCSNLTSILIPETVGSIGEDAFDGCEVPSLLRHVMVRVIGRGGTCARKTVRAAETGKNLVRRLQREAARLRDIPDAADESAFGLLECELRVTTCDGRELCSREERAPVRPPVRNLKENEYSVECSATQEGVWISRLVRLEEDELEALKMKHCTG